ncbi:MAG: GGDEF domain-containing protein [Chitinivibrionales bacterium]
MKIKNIKVAEIFRSEVIAVTLLCFTVIMWLSYEFLMNRVFILDAKNPDFVFTTVNDRRDGGNSTTKIHQTDSTIILDYELKPGAPYPFATLHLDPTSGTRKGIDLSVYDEIRLWARLKAESGKRMRFHFRNAHPDYFRELDSVSLKYNEVHLQATTLDTPRVLSWKYFHVPGWWIAKKGIPYHHGIVDVHNVRWIQLLSPEIASSGKGRIEFRKLELRGKWISADDFFKLLLLLWMGVWALFALLRISSLIKLLRQKEEREQELVKLNQALSIQTNEFKQRAQRDELTGLLNRHGMRDRLFQLLKQIRSNDKAMSVIFVDIDHFKRINDTLGHAEGDRILRITAQALSENTRDCDILARWGGEEFVIVSPIGVESAKKLAKKLRRIIAELPEKVTCSFGVSSSMAAGDLQALLGYADEALYRAKDNGRNCVVVIDGTRRGNAAAKKSFEKDVHVEQI